MIEVRNDGKDLRRNAEKMERASDSIISVPVLRQRYGDAASLTLNPIESGGCYALLNLPLDFSSFC